MNVVIPVEVSGGSARRARARRILIRQLRKAEAYSLEKAVPLAVESRLQERELARLVRKEVIRPGKKEGYWLDRERYADFQRQRILFVVGALLVAAGFVACMILYGPKH